MTRPLKKHPRDQQVTTTFRLPGELRARLQAEADANDRSLSQECVRRLRMSFEGGTALPNGRANHVKERRS